jgi:prepilin-type N-terminal cleavage/methylation domain-containing protein/prepilin-type processing-associated H-X9-DG protein
MPRRLTKQNNLPARSACTPRRGRRANARKAFTLIELLVVIAIIALLVSILLPSLNRARDLAKAMASMVNVRSWGQGTIMLTNETNGLLPWDGEKNISDLDENLPRPEWWGNAVPPYVGEPTYAELFTDGRIPLPGDKSLFIDPAAKTPSDYPGSYRASYNGATRTVFFCYVINANLNANAPSASNDWDERICLDTLEDSASVVLMLEKRTRREELESDDPYYSESLDRTKADWQRFGARHSDGGHILFADGHAEHVSNEQATTSVNGTRTGNEPDEEMNKSGLIWSPGL